MMCAIFRWINTCIYYKIQFKMIYTFCIQIRRGGKNDNIKSAEGQVKHMYHMLCKHIQCVATWLNDQAFSATAGSTAFAFLGAFAARRLGAIVGRSVGDLESLQIHQQVSWYILGCQKWTCNKKKLFKTAVSYGCCAASLTTVIFCQGPKSNQLI